MPMYEFLCGDCNVIYTFFSRKVDIATIPECPKKSTHQLQRMISRFALTRGNGSGNDSENDDNSLSNLPIDETKMEHALQSLATEAEHMQDDDPQQAADLMRKLTSMAGLKLGDKMEDALSRIEAGEDPDAIEREIGELDESDLFTVGSTLKRTAKRPPSRDETIYDM